MLVKQWIRPLLHNTAERGGPVIYFGFQFDLFSPIQTSLQCACYDRVSIACIKCLWLTGFLNPMLLRYRQWYTCIDYCSSATVKKASGLFTGLNFCSVVEMSFSV